MLGIKSSPERLAYTKSLHLSFQGCISGPSMQLRTVPPPHPAPLPSTTRTQTLHLPGWRENGHEAETENSFKVFSPQTMSTVIRVVLLPLCSSRANEPTTSSYLKRSETEGWELLVSFRFEHFPLLHLPHCWCHLCSYATLVDNRCVCVSGVWRFSLSPLLQPHRLVRVAVKAEVRARWGAIQVPILALSFINNVTLGRWWSITESRFPYLQNGKNNRT